VRYDGNDGPYTIDPKDIGSYLREENITEEAIKDKKAMDCQKALQSSRQDGLHCSALLVKFKLYQ